MVDDNYRTRSWDQWLSDHLVLVLLVILGVALIVVVVAFGVYATYFPGPIESEHDRWGQFGDFIGGTLNPILGFLSLLALLMTLAIQNRELSISSKELANSARALAEQSKALELQNFERTFFELVRLHHSIIAAIDLRNSEGQTTAVGRDCFRIFYDKRLRKAHDTMLRQLTGRTPEEIAQEAYTHFFGDNQHEIGHYFRNLYRVFKFIDETSVFDDRSGSFFSGDRFAPSPMARKQQYASIMRAQLSSYELALLFYNSLHAIGAKFKPLIETYALFENMRLGDLFNPLDHVPLYAVPAYGDQDLSRYLQKA